MWKVLIADDEPKIRRGLRSSIEKLQPGMTVVAEAEDGEIALSLVEKEKPDILLIDIRMPFLGGLELIERIAGVHRDCIVIVVTGHDEFEYAKRALQLKVFEYVLKPVQQDVLASVLSRAEEQLTESRRQNQYAGWAREQLERNMPLLREQFFREWVHGRLSRTEIDEQAAYLGIEIRDRYSMALVRIGERFLAAELIREKDRRIVLCAMRTVVEESLGPLNPCYVFQDEQDNIVAIAPVAGGPAWVRAIGEIESRAADTPAQGATVSTRVVPGGTESIPDTYDALTAETAVKATQDSFVILAGHYIDAHYREPELSLEEVADEVEISPGYLSRLLKQETGYSFIDYLTRVRIARAVQLMNDPAMKIYEVAEAVGYQSQHYFSRAFKKVLGRSPVDYRKGGADT